MCMHIWFDVLLPYLLCRKDSDTTYHPRVHREACYLHNQEILIVLERLFHLYSQSTGGATPSTRALSLQFKGLVTIPLQIRALGTEARNCMTCIVYVN